MKANKYKIGLGLLVSYIGLTIITTLLLWAVYSIPREQLYPQIVSSIPILENEGTYPLIPYYGNKARDNTSDACMLNVAFGAEEGSPVDNLKSALRSEEPMEVVELEGLKSAVFHYPQKPESVSYCRYWHGYQIYLRPLLTIFDLQQIRIINFILLYAVACVALIILWRKLGVWYAVIMLLSLLSVAFHIVPKCMQFSSVFYVGMISMIISMLIVGNKHEYIFRPILFFLSGAITSSLDLLTAPMIPLVLLLLVDTLMHQYMGDSKQQFWGRIQDLVGYGILWCIGYAQFWATKFALGSIILDVNIFSDGIHQALYRMDAQSYSLVGWFTRVIMLPVKQNYVLFLCCIATVYIIMRWKKYKVAIMNNAWLFIIALIEPIWLFLLRQHSMMHYVLFVWRSEIILVLCMAIFVYRVISQTKSHEKSIQ